MQNKSLSRLDTMKNKAKILSEFNRLLMNKRTNSSISGNLQALIHCPIEKLSDFLNTEPPSEEQIESDKKRRQSIENVTNNTYASIKKIIKSARRQSTLEMPGLTAGEDHNKPILVYLICNINVD